MSEKKLPSCLTTKQIEEVLKSKGIQATAQRIAVCQYVLCDAEHVTVEEVKAWADKNFPKISLATVYNTLNILVDANLLKALKLSHSEKVLYDNNIEPHYHFLDESSQKLYDIEPEKVGFSYNLDKNYKVTSFDVLLKGTKIS